MIETILTSELIEGYTRAGYWGSRTWPDYIDESARNVPGRVAVIDSAGSMTYGEFSRQISRIALHLLEHGIRKEDRVGIQLPNWHEFLLMRFALAKIGAIAVPLPIDWRQKEVQHVLSSTEAVAVLTPGIYHDRDFAREISDLLPSCRHIRLLFVARAGETLPDNAVSFDDLLKDSIEERADPETLRQAHPHANEVDLVVTTSGSTAAPKMVVRTPNCFMATARQFQLHRGLLTGDDVVAGLAPITRGMGYYVGVASAILGGSTMALLEKFAPGSALSWLEETKATVAVAVPTQIVKMLQMPDLYRYDLAALRILVNGGAAIAPSIAEEAERKLGCVLLTAYGSVEGATPACTAQTDPPIKRYHSVGRTMPGMELRIVDDAGRPVPNGTAGEVVYRGPGLSLGFWRNAQGYRELLDKDGWFPSGDLGTLDDEGYLTIVGRKKEIIIRGGINISPSEVEGLLQENEEVSSIAVVKMPDPVLGERCCAFIVPIPGKEPTVTSIAQFLDRRGVAKYKFPERVELRAELPMTPDGGKVMRKALEEEIAQLVERERSGRMKATDAA